MPLPFTRRPLKRRTRWVLGAVVLLLAIIAVPFIFTTSLVRFALAHSAYARFSPTVYSATLHPSGALELHGLSLHEPSSALELLWLGEVKLQFSWRDIWGAKVRSIEIRSSKIHLRPGVLGDAGSPSVSILQLASSGPESGKAGAPAGRPFWYDTLDLAGTVEVEPFPGAPPMPASFPFDIHSRMRADRMAPWRDFSLSIHGESAQQTLALNFTTHPEGDRTIVDLHDGSIGAIHTVTPLPPSLAKSLGPQAEVSIDRLALRGTVTFDPALPPRADVTMKAENLCVLAEAPTKKKFALQHLNVAGHAVAPLASTWSTDATLSETVLSFDTLSAAKSSISNAATGLSLTHGTLTTQGLHFTLAGGIFTGDVQFDLVHQRLASAKLNVQRLDQQQLAANLAPDKLDAEGTTSGTAALASDAQGTWTGDIELTADGPGKLKIKDQAAAEALAGKLETGAAAGVLPANFSTIVVQQLKDYPYVAGHVRVEAPHGVPAVTLNYTRKPIGPGDPGYGVQTTIAGQSVLANYTIQLPALTVVLQGKTIGELVALAAGFEKQVADAPATK